MDNIKRYNYFFQKAHLITKRIIIAEMKKSKEKNRPFLTVHNKICKNLFDYNTSKYTEILRSTYTESFNLFNDRYSYYQGESDDVIKWILEDEVFETFTKVHTISYDRFVTDLAIESSLKEAQRHYRHYKDYYELIYDLDMYDNFFFQDFDGISFASSICYKKMMDIKYPYLVTERKESLKSEKLRVKQKDDIPKTSTGVEYSTIEILNSFTDDEKYLLINILYSLKTDSNFAFTDFMKLMRIVGTYENISIFNKNPKSTTTYTKAIKGIDYYSGDGQLKLIESTLNKLSSFNIEIVRLKLLRMRTEFHKNTRNKDK
ncbi:hypothetical protein [Bizionia sp.]|uniref:hypothetical protein n=1 Tax=Bizionia sp. TaxID=1954480 RepID=UPI003A93A25A